MLGLNHCPQDIEAVQRLGVEFQHSIILSLLGPSSAWGLSVTVLDAVI